MDFQVFVDTFSTACAVLSVKKGVAGHASEIRIHKANDFYKTMMGTERFKNDMLYSELVPREEKFEDFCYRCAVEKQKFHYYIKVTGLPIWSEINLLPLKNDGEDLFYCAFLVEASKIIDSEKMADISPEMAVAVIKNCMILRGSKDFYNSLNLVMADLREKTGGYASSLILLNKEKRDFKILSEKFINDNVAERNFKSMLSYNLVESWEKTLGESDGIIIKDDYDMESLKKKNSLWAESLKHAEVDTLIFYPLLQGKETIGYLFITNFNTENLVKIKELVSLTAFFLSSEIASHTFVEKLEKLGHEDLLTGVKNRNAMNTRVDSFVSGEKKIEAPFGVVFADLNGLKQENDKNGHAAGDAMIKAAAEYIKEFFSGYEIYRAGGDEFVIICPACLKETFDAKITALKAKTCYGSKVSLAIGADWSQNGDDLRHSMHVADEAMYRDKAAFYRAHSDIDRRCRR